jgi:hypothetical protein
VGEQQAVSKVRTSSARLAGAAMLVVAGTAWAVGQGRTPAFASASGCTFAGNGFLGENCMVIDGNGQSVHTAQESYSNGIPPTNICKYQAKWYGDTTSEGWHTYTAGYIGGCSPGYADEVLNLSPKEFVKNSGFYGYFRCNDTDETWSSPVKETIK